MTIKEELIQKIRNKAAVVGVTGLGYVGLPLALEKAKAGYRTIGFDIQENKVRMVNEGKNYVGDIVDSDLSNVVSSGRLSATPDFSRISETDCVTICVPTPLDSHGQPDISYVVQSAREIAKYLHKGMLVVLESTTYPGTTEEEVKTILEDTGLKCGTEFFLAFSPERVDPGNKEYKVKNTPKVVGGVTRDCTEVAAELYRNVLESRVIEVSSPAVAEMEKILENTYRNVNIALINEIAMTCHRMGINVWEVIEAARSKPYGFTAFYPGPGPGGHCIPIDPFYLSWKAKEYDFHTRLIETAGEINSYMPDFIVERAIQILNNIRKPLKGSKVLLLGVAYKQDIDDCRESPALKLLDKFGSLGADVAYNDPFIPSCRYRGKEYKSCGLTPEILTAADLVIVTAMHSCYDYDFIQKHSQKVFDLKNAMKNVKCRDNVELL